MAIVVGWYWIISRLLKRTPIAKSLAAAFPLLMRVPVVLDGKSPFIPPQAMRTGPAKRISSPV